MYVRDANIQSFISVFEDTKIINKDRLSLTTIKIFIIYQLYVDGSRGLFQDSGRQ
jgi:hypothetical protein